MAKATIPTVFISSTVDDLKLYRKAVADAARKAGFLTVMSEDFSAKDVRPLDECLAKVAEADLVVAIVAHRYGWVPNDPLNQDNKSITWLECQHASQECKGVLAFVVDNDQEWEHDRREGYRIMFAAQSGTATPELLEEVQRNVAKLGEFKDWLNNRAIRNEFTSPEDLRGKVSDALHDWRNNHPEFATVAPSAKRIRQDNPREYLQFLREETAHIDIRGLRVGSGQANRIPIEELYIPLTSAPAQEEPNRPTRRKDSRGKEKGGELLDRAAHASIPLQRALAHQRVVIVGDPGAGKTTFVHRIAFALSQTLLGEEPSAAEDRLGLSDTPFPILIPIAPLVEHIRNSSQDKTHSKPTTADLPEWLIDFLAARSAGLNWGLRRRVFPPKAQCRPKAHDRAARWPG